MIFSHKHEMLSSFTIRIVRQNKLAKSQPWFGRSTGTEFKIWVDWWLYVYILLYDWYLISRRTQLSRILVAEITLFGVGEIVYIVLPGYCPIRFDWSFHSLLISSVQFRTNPQIFRTINSTLLYTLQPRTADMETPPCVYHFLVESSVFRHWGATENRFHLVSVNRHAGFKIETQERYRFGCLGYQETYDFCMFWMFWVWKG